MSWFRRKKKFEPEFDIITNDVPMSLVFRWYLYDTDLTDDINELAEIIGLSRVSEEGESKEREDSDSRMRNIEPLYPFLDSMSDLSSSVIAALHLKEMMESEEELPNVELEKIVASMHNIYKVIALSTLMGTFSSALELGIIQTNTLSSATFVPKEDDDE